MATRNCATCGREFELRFGDTVWTRKCPDCDLQRYEAGQAEQSPLAQAAAGQAGNAAIPRFYPVTIGLIAVNAVVFAIMVLRGASFVRPTPQQALAFGADFGPLTLNGEWWRLVTSMFVHYGIVHIGLNMWCLWNLGCAAEALMGRASYLLGYFVSGIFGSIASVYWQPMGVGAGASGAIFGMAGVLVSFIYLKKTPAKFPLNKNFLGSLGTFIFYNLAFGAAIPGISNAAHIGGLVMGLAVGAMLPAADASESARRTRLSVIVILSGVALVASAVATKRLRAGTAELAAIQELIAKRRTDEAMAQLQQLTSREPQLAPAQAMLGSIYFAKGRFPEAIAALEKACEADPHNSSYPQQLGAAYVAAGQFENAIAVFQKMTRVNSSDPRGFLGLGFTYMAMQQYDSAIAEFRDAVAVDPRSAAAQHALGQAQLKAGRYADAQATYRKLLEQFPSDARAKTALDFATRQTH